MATMASGLKNDLQCFIDEHETQGLALLPSMHSTTCHSAESIFRHGSISTTPCPVFNENLAYFFYGKPLFKVSPSYNAATTNYMFGPVCFIVDTAKLKAKRIFPFDSGAFDKGMYAKILPNHAKKDDYQLSSNVNLIPRYVELFFGDNDLYQEGKSFPHSDVETSIITYSLALLLGASGVMDFDGRSRTIEISTDDEVSLSDCVDAIIIPAPFFRNSAFNTFHKNHPNIKVISYHVHFPENPCALNEAVYQRAADYISKQSEVSL